MSKNIAPGDGTFDSIREVSITDREHQAYELIGGRVYRRVSFTPSTDTAGQETITETGTADASFEDAITTATPDKNITTVLIENLEQRVTRDLNVSFDGGTTFKTIRPGAARGFAIKGNLKQFKVRRGAAATVDVTWDAWINREA